MSHCGQTSKDCKYSTCMLSDIDITQDVVDIHLDDIDVSILFGQSLMP